jgi:hypothetical protein
VDFSTAGTFFGRGATNRASFCAGIGRASIVVVACIVINPGAGSIVQVLPIHGSITGISSTQTAGGRTAAHRARHIYTAPRTARRTGFIVRISFVQAETRSAARRCGAHNFIPIGKAANWRRCDSLLAHDFLFAHCDCLPFFMRSFFSTRFAIAADIYPLLVVTF